MCSSAVAKYRIFASARKQIKKLAEGILLSFVIFVVISILIGPALGQDQYESILVNLIRWVIMSIVTTASLFMIYNKYKCTLNIFILLYYFIHLRDFTIYSNSRSSIIAIFMQFLQLVWC